MKYIGIDYGEKKIGIALSDGLGLMSFPKQVLHYTQKTEMFSSISQFIEKEAVQAIVVGIPFYKDGTISVVGQQVYGFIEELLSFVSLPCYTINEYLTSFEAKKQMQVAGKQSKVVDAHAARVLLEDFLQTPINKRILYKGL